MADVLDFLQPIFPFIFVTLWLGGYAFLFFYVYGKKAREYARRFPPINGVPREWGSTDWKSAREDLHLLFDVQPDPELELLRHDVLWRMFYAVLWLFGFPFLTIAFVALLAADGFVHLH